MLTAKQFILQNETEIQKEIDAIVDCISSQLEAGYFHMDWSLDFAPSGAAGFIAIKVKEKLGASGWICESQVGAYSLSIKFTISPNLSYLL